MYLKKRSKHLRDFSLFLSWMLSFPPSSETGRRADTRAKETVQALHSPSPCLLGSMSPSPRYPPPSSSSFQRKKQTFSLWGKKIISLTVKFPDWNKFLFPEEECLFFIGGKFPFTQRTTFFLTENSFLPEGKTEDLPLFWVFHKYLCVFVGELSYSE